MWRWHRENLPSETNLAGTEGPVWALFRAAKYQPLIPPPGASTTSEVAAARTPQDAHTVSDGIHVSREIHRPACFRGEQRMLTAPVLRKWTCTEGIDEKIKQKPNSEMTTENGLRSGVGSF